MSLKRNGAARTSIAQSALLKKLQRAISERPIEPIEVDPSTTRQWTRRDLPLLGAGALAALAVGGSQLPREVWQRLGFDTASDLKISGY